MKKHIGKTSNTGFKKQLRLLPGHLIVGIWCLFTLVMLFWIVAASLSTAPEIMRGKVLSFESGLHFENYVRAWSANSISVFFLNSLLYAICAMVGSILISAPAAYVLARFVFKGNLVIKSSFITAMSIPQIMIVLPLFSMATRTHLSGSKIILILLYIGMQIPYTTTFLLASFSNLSRVYEEAAAIDGCPPMKTFWKIMLPLAQPGIVTVGIFNFMNVWNEYFLSLISYLCFFREEHVRGIGLKKCPDFHAVYRRLGRIVCRCRYRIFADAAAFYIIVKDNYRRYYKRRCQRVSVCVENTLCSLWVQGIFFVT